MSGRLGRNYLVLVLTLVLISVYIDRVAFGLLLQDIKEDLRLTDTELGMLTGIAFAFFYSLMGIPIARWADRGNRIAIVAITTALWSAAVAACALVANFAQLLMVRVATAVGEAGCAPPANSLIADYFDRGERPRAVAFYMLGGALGTFLGFYLAGWLNERYGWRVTFVILGVPGIAIAALTSLTLRDTRQNSRTARNQPDGCTPRVESMRVVWSQLWHIKSFRYILISFSVCSFFGSGVYQWQPAFFVRSFGLRTDELGRLLAVVYGGSSALGLWLGGEVASRFAARNERRQLSTIATIYCLFGLTNTLLYCSTSLPLAVGLITIGTIGFAMATAPIYAMLQALVPPSKLATSIAIIYLVSNLVGQGLGPLLVGIISDVLGGWAGQESLRYALLAMSPGYFIAAWFVWRAGHTIAKDIADAQQDRAPPLSAPEPGDAMVPAGGHR
jgi:MFS family permease